MTVLLVESQTGVRQAVRDQLQNQGLEVTTATTLVGARNAAAHSSFRVVVVDLVLPDGSGLDLLDTIRQSGASSHVVVLSGSAAESDRLRAFDLGADDYVVKPFFIRELTARVLAVHRRRVPNDNVYLNVGRLRIDLVARQVVADGMVLALTPKEFDLLAYLAARSGHVFSRDQLLKAVWHSGSDWQQPATVTEHIARLRAKIEADPHRPSVIRTVRGVGYRLDLPRDEVATESVTLNGASPVVPGIVVHVDGVIVFADRAAGVLLGLEDEAELLGRHLCELVAARSKHAAREMLALADAGLPPRSQLMDLERGDGTQVSVEVASRIVDWHGQRAGRVALTRFADASSRLRRLVTGVLSEVTEAVIITDLSFHIRSWNVAAERLYGWVEHDVIGRHVLDVWQWVGDGGELAAAWESLELKGRWNGEGQQATRDGSVVSVRTSATLLRDESGSPIGVVSVNRLSADVGRAEARELGKDEEARLCQGMANNEFDVYYQPIVSLDDRHLIALEALVRWIDPERGVLAPAEFLDAAERSGLIIELGQFMLERACSQVAQWRRGGADIELAVNLSTRQLCDPGVVDRFITSLVMSGLDPKVVWLEVTETALVTELDKVSLVLGRLVELGVRVAIDDFGTGWASLTYLQNFPVHALKIDRSFVAGVGHNPTDTAIARSILLLGAELDLIVVAEGIETDAQHKALQQLGCYFGQGYLYGRPTSPVEVPIEWARRLEPTADDATRDTQRVERSPNDGAHRAPATPVAAGAGDDSYWGLTHSTTAALQTRSRHQPLRVGATSFAMATERIELDAVASLLRGLLQARSAPIVAELLHQTVRRMGGTLVAVADAGVDALPIDVSLGEGPPMLVDVERFTVARMQLERLLPRLLEDARQAVDLLRQTERLEHETTRDPLTGLTNRRVLDRVIPRAVSGVVVMIDLDHFKQVNDQGGHAAGDAVLACFGRVLAQRVRAVDTCCRVGGEEFAIVIADGNVESAQTLIERIRLAWTVEAPEAVTFSAGVATVSGDRGGTSALIAADRALYRAKALGRNRTEVDAEVAEGATEA